MGGEIFILLRRRSCPEKEKTNTVKKLIVNSESIKILKKIDWKIWGTFLLILVLYLPQIFLNDLPQRDVAYRYAPAAEAFARGDWQYAFHPRLQFLHPFVSGIMVWLFSISGFLGAKLSGLLFYALGVFPFFSLMKEAFNRKIAYWSLLFYLFASRLIILSSSGLRESHKLFAILLIVLGLVQVWKYRKDLKGYLLLGAACGLSVCTRNEMLLFAVLLFSCGIAMDAKQNRIPFRSMLGGGLAVLFAFPEFLVNYMKTGYTVPGSRYLELFEKAFHCPPTPFNTAVVFLILAGIAFLILFPLLGWILRMKYGPQIVTTGIILAFLVLIVKIFTGKLLWNTEMLSDFLQSIFKGQFPVLFFLMLPGLAYRIVTKRFSVPEKILLICYLLQGGLIILLILGCDKYLYISSRYLLPATPLFFGWIVFTFLLVLRLLQKIPLITAYRKAVTGLLLAGLLTFLYIDSWSPIFNLYGKSDKTRAQIHGISRVIQNDYHGERFWRPEFELSTYYPNTRPAVWFEDTWKVSVAAYGAGGSACRNLKDADYLVLPEGKIPKTSDWEKVGAAVTGKRFNVQVWRKK